MMRVPILWCAAAVFGLTSVEAMAAGPAQAPAPAQTRFTSGFTAELPTLQWLRREALSGAVSGWSAEADKQKSSKGWSVCVC